MFYNDPTLYGATLPYKDFPMQTPFVPWQKYQGFQQFMPQVFPQAFGQTWPYGYNFGQMTQPQLNAGAFNPFFQPGGFNYNIPPYGWHRPLPY